MFLKIDGYSFFITPTFLNINKFFLCPIKVVFYKMDIILQWLFYFNLVLNSYENLKLDHVVIFQFELFNIHISNK